MNKKQLEPDCQIEINHPFGIVLTPRYAGQSLHELPVEVLRALSRQNHLLILRQFHSGFSDSQKLVHYAERWGNIMMWPFGAVLDVKEHPDTKDHVFDSSYMPFHWDGMYKPTVPEFLLFHCVAAPSQSEGGRTTFVDTTRLLKNTDKTLLDLWRSVSISYRLKKVTHYGGELCSPLIVEHPRGEGLIMRYNEPFVSGKKFLNKHALEYHNLPSEQQQEFIHTLQQQLYDPRYYYAHQWQQGDVAIVDNFSLLHGREGYLTRSSRHLQRVHIQANPVFINQFLK